VVELILRLFGLLWIFGGLVTIRASRQSLFLDSALEQITLDKVDRFDSYFLLICGGLTFICGLLLFLLNQWVIIFLLLLVLSQIFYFQVKNRRLIQAESLEEQSSAIVNQTTKNAFITSLLVTFITLIYILIRAKN
jgi:hypothetical protein